MLPHHLQAGAPDLTATSEIPGLDVGPGAANAFPRRFRNENTHEHERADGERIKRRLRPEAQAPERPRNDHHGHQPCEEGPPGSRENSRGTAERDVKLPCPRKAPVPLRKAEVPRHRKGEHAHPSEVVRVLAQCREPPLRVRPRTGQIVVYVMSAATPAPRTNAWSSARWRSGDHPISQI